MTQTYKSKRAVKGSAPVSRPSSLNWLWLVVAVVAISGLIAVGLFLRSNAASESPEPAAATGSVEQQPTRAPVLGPADHCRRQPVFAQAEGFSQEALISTSQQEPMGLVVFDNIDAQGIPARVFQDPSWDDAGWLGHITLDSSGNVYVFPAPRENLVDNPPERANVLYRVDSTSMQLTPFITVTQAAPPSPENPYGILGAALDCDLNSLFVATVAGSTRADELGKIVRIDLATRQEVTAFANVDVFGVTVYNSAEGKRLYYGLARTPDLYSIALDSNGAFSGEPRYELTMPDTNFKAWRLRFDKEGVLQVRGLEFDFNLKATSERREVSYTFRFNSATNAWEEQAG
jgi:hypothetical protein